MAAQSSRSTKRRVTHRIEHSAVAERCQPSPLDSRHSRLWLMNSGSRLPQSTEGIQNRITQQPKSITVLVSV